MKPSHHHNLHLFFGGCSFNWFLFLFWKLWGYFFRSFFRIVNASLIRILKVARKQLKKTKYNLSCFVHSQCEFHTHTERESEGEREQNKTVNTEKCNTIYYTFATVWWAMPHLLFIINDTVWAFELKLYLNFFSHIYSI